MLALLKIESRSLISAAIMTAIINPRAPGNSNDALAKLILFEFFLGGEGVAGRYWRRYKLPELLACRNQSCCTIFFLTRLQHRRLRYVEARSGGSDAQF